MTRHREQEKIVGVLASFLSTLAAVYFFRTGQVLLYGDAVAHINIARRVVDNLTPGPFQLGTVWLPLPHLLMLPLVWMDKFWVSGLSGALPSMIAYVIAVLGVFRLLLLLTSRTTAWIGALFFALNPNLLYMQSTAMTESVYLAAMIWAIYYLCDFDLRLRDTQPGAGTALQRAAIALSACILIRYDGWFLTAACAVAVAIRFYSLEARIRKSLLKPSLRSLILPMTVAGFWLAWNYGIFGNPVEFANGPYSAKAIAERTTPKGDPPYPGKEHPVTAAVYFLKSAKLNVTEGTLEKPVLLIALFGLIFTVFEKRRRFVLLLWTPLIFYSLSIAYGAVPIFIPQWWPFSYYNVRYGMQLLPAIVIFFALAAHYLRRVHLARWYVHAITVFFGLVALFSYVAVLRYVPICLREARVNSITRAAMEKQIAQQFVMVMPNQTVLMFTGEYSGALQRADIPFRSVINEGNFGIWQSALQAPSRAADWVIASEGDAVSQAVKDHPQGLDLVSVLHVQGKRPVTIYRTNRRLQ
jgi:4-amino-4-deoxy-L-arabinose transferase-like glycosyltransferase